MAMPSTRRATPFEINLWGLAEALNKELSDPLVAIWRRRYEHLPADLFTRAVELALDSCTFFPSPVEFGRFVEAALPPEDRALVEDARRIRGWLSVGFLPVNWTPEQLALFRAGLGLPPPAASDLDYLARQRAAQGLTDPERPGLGAGPLEAYLRGRAREDGGALLALASGGGR